MILQIDWDYYTLKWSTGIFTEYPKHFLLNNLKSKITFVVREIPRFVDSIQGRPNWLHDRHYRACGNAGGSMVEAGGGAPDRERNHIQVHNILNL